MRLMVIDLFLTLGFAVSAHAQLRTQTPMTFSVRLAFAKAAEIETLSKIESRLKAGDRSVCQHRRHLSMAACSLTLIRTYRVHSSQGLRRFFDLAVSAAVVDRSYGLSENQVQRELTENFLAIAESARPEKFFAQKVRAVSRSDKAERVQARIIENASLASFQSQVFPLIQGQIEKSSPSLAFRARAEALRQRRWALR